MLINQLPSSLKKSLKFLWGYTPLNIRYGKTFRRTYKFLNESQWWSKQEIDDYQLRTIRMLLEHAYQNVPYYTDVFDERGLKPSDITNIKDLEKLPVLTKDIISNNLSRLTAKNYPRSKLLYVATGGSTGIPTGFYWEKGRTDIEEQAFVWRSWNWAGYYFGQRKVVLRGTVIGSSTKDENEKYYEFDPSDNALMLSSYFLCEDNFKKYIGKIKEFQPVIIQGYPSSLYLLARYLKSTKQKIENVKSIITSSENLYQDHRSLIEDSFGSKVYDHYGNTERTCIAFQCELAENYHIIPEYGITELVDENGKQIEKSGKIGEILSTGFLNFAMPFIRYETEDLARYAEGTCPCGRNHKLLKDIEGRLQEIIITKDNRFISMTAVNMHSNVFDNVHQIQFHQREKGAVVCRIVRKKDYSQNDTDNILNELSKKISGALDIEIDFVGDIPRTSRGKHRWLIQELDTEKLRTGLD